MRAAAIERLRAAGHLDVPASLPIADRTDDLLAAIRDHQVVIVAGETGSGKSTQLPKLCLTLGRGAGGTIGHTQPRRVAARTIAERVAEELGVELGGEVGYAVRFTDRVGPSTLVKVMTDGILLAELQRDRDLRRYDTIIVDEAHERSLNVDFLLGYLKQLLPRRPDLKVIVTSATIDTARFSAHFDGAPVVEVSGRTYPVEVRYRPYGAAALERPGDDRDQVQAVCDAVDELLADTDGDVLVFLSGEREIHDTADALRRLERRAGGRPVDVLPLYARLSSVEQHRIFQAHHGRRVVLATNVAETSLTVPGVRSVIDTGTARISRYSLRLKVQRLPIEPISRASADQRAGRCGRVAPGVCIRLYAEDDLLGRPEFTEPEILRTNLASVILQMTAIGLGDVERFPFVEPPDRRSVRDGYALLEELGAIDSDSRRLTKVGRRLARLPVDPRLGRMVLEADRHGCVREVLVIAAALSIQDPRERPLEAEQAADEAHRRFDVDGSDLLAFVRLWDHLRERHQALSSSAFRRLCRAEFLNYLRVREWQDLYSQLRQVAGELGVRSGTEAGHPDRVHQAVLAGLLSHLGMRDGDSREFRGAHGSRFVIGRGSSLAKKPPKWVMAAQLVETDRLRARVVAPVQPEWAERLAGPLVRYAYTDPEWDAQRGAAVTVERATLFGLPIVTARRIGYDRIDRAGARELFIRHALVEGDVDVRPTALRRVLDDNRDVLARTRELAERARHDEPVDDETLHEFYDSRIGAEVVSIRHFERWWRSDLGGRVDELTATPDLLLGGTQLDLAGYPGEWRHGSLLLPVSYLVEPGSPHDGVTVHVPIVVLNRVSGEGFDWQVPALRPELVQALVRTLPKEIRRDLVPAADTVRAAFALLPAEPSGRLVDRLADALTQVAGVRVAGSDFDADRVPANLRVGFAIESVGGDLLASGHDLEALRETMRVPLRRAIADHVPVQERAGIITWDVGEVPRVVEGRWEGLVVRGHPALLDDGDSVSLRVFPDEATQQRVMRAGVRRLLLLAVPGARRSVAAGVTNAGRLAIARAGLAADALVDDCLTAAADSLLAGGGGLPWDESAFAALRASAKDRLASGASAALRTACEACVAVAAVEARVQRLVVPSLQPAVEDVRAQVARLVRPGFVTATGTGRLVDVVRYLRAADRRLERLPEHPAKDAQSMAQVHALEARYRALLRRSAQLPASKSTAADVIELGWSLEELRVGLFAQAVGTSRPVSVRRLDAALRAHHA